MNAGDLNARTCPMCMAEDSRVRDVRVNSVTEILERRRECRACGHRWTTVEIPRSAYGKFIRENKEEKA